MAISAKSVNFTRWNASNALRDGFFLYFLLTSEKARTMTTTLESLSQQIARQQTELEALRREYEERQTRLADLTGRKEELQAQLQQVEADIQAVAEGNGVRQIPSANAPQAKLSQAKPARKQTLPALLVDVVRQAAGPITVKQLTEEVLRRKFPTTSGNIRHLVDTKVRLLVKRGMLRRAPGRAGVLPGKSSTGGMASAGKTQHGRTKVNKRAAAVPKAAPPKKAEGRQQPLSLRAMLTNLLARSKRPLTGRELGERALANGYQTASGDFLGVVSVTLARMDNIENVPGKGYQLTRR
jgi:hypothetical protein